MGWRRDAHGAAAASGELARPLVVSARGVEHNLVRKALFEGAVAQGTAVHVVQPEIHVCLLLAYIVAEVLAVVAHAVAVVLCRRFIPNASGKQPSPAMQQQSQQPGGGLLGYYHV